jgi:hypothetical protein
VPPHRYAVRWEGTPVLTASSPNGVRAVRVGTAAHVMSSLRPQGRIVAQNALIFGAALNRSSPHPQSVLTASSIGPHRILKKSSPRSSISPHFCVKSA